MFPLISTPVRAGPEPVIYQGNKIEPRSSERWAGVTDVGV